MAQPIRREQAETNTRLSEAGAADQLIELLSRSSRYLALLVAWVATSGSLFFSEALHWLPCIMCWYQRILMYPLAIILAVGILRRDERLHMYVLPFSLVGACVSLYHYLLIKTDWLPPPPCVAGIPCTTDYLNWLGFINIPFLALTAFLLINFMMAVSMFVPLDAEADADSSAGAARSDDRAPMLFSPANGAVVGIIAVVVMSFVIAARFV